MFCFMTKMNRPTIRTFKTLNSVPPSFGFFAHKENQNLYFGQSNNLTFKIC